MPDKNDRPVAPRPLPDGIERTLRAAEQRLRAEAKSKPTPPRWPMLSGVFTFPFYLRALGAWLFITAGLIVTAWLVMFWLAYGAVMGMTTARLFGLPACAAAILTFGYAASCCLIIIEQTAYDLDAFEIDPGIDWKEWVWNFGRIAALMLQAGIVGAVLTPIIPMNHALWLAISTFVTFPFVLLGALAAGEAWVPVAIVSVFRGVARLWWAWGLFFLETTPLFTAWAVLAGTGLSGRSPWLTPLYASPLLAAAILIYARLLGRLAGCIAASTKPIATGDDNED